MDGSEQLLWLHFSLALSPTSDLCSSIFCHFLKLVSLRSCTPSTPHLCNMGGKDGRDFLQCNADCFYVASLERPRKNFLVRSLSLNISSPACLWLLGGSVACSGEVKQGPVNYCPAFCIPLRLVCLLGPVRQKEGRERGLVFPHLPVKVSRF